MSNFTVEDAIVIQDRHLAEWKTKLLPEVYDKLYIWAKAGNNRPEKLNQSQIRRGIDLTNWVCNYMYSI